MPTIFQQDLADEATVTKHLSRTLFPEIFTDFSLTNDTDKQLQGNDLTATRNTDTITIDIKSQLDYINTPKHSFILEILSQTNNKIKTGWYTKQDTTTDYYLFTWLPKVDQFKLTPETNTIHYYPASTITPANFINTHENKYTFPTTKIDQFAEKYYPLQKSQLTPNKKTFTQHSIREHHTALVSKEKLTTHLNSHGLTKKKLTSDAVQVAKTQENKSYNINNIYSLYYTSRHHQNPVNLVINYALYHELADLTATITPKNITFMDSL